MNKTWWKEAVCYQVYLRSFMDSNGDGIGDLPGLISKLDYLKELGIDVIWVSPFYKSPNADNGYDISDYQSIAKEFGEMADVERLLLEAHQRGMKVILDLVLNHTSDEHPWFIESRSSRNNPKRDWYIWRDGRNGREPNNWESIFSGSAWKFDEGTNQYYLHIFAEKQPDLNWRNKQVRQALYEIVNEWLDKGIDGFRIDAITHILKRDGLPDVTSSHSRQYSPTFEMYTNQDGILDYLRELKEKTFSRYDVMTVGEANGVSSNQAEDWVGEQNGVFNMIFQFEHLGLWKRGHGEEPDVAGLKRTLTKWQKGLHQRGWNALFFENHDQPRSVSTWGDDGQYWRESAKMLGALYFFMQGTPFIYQGQEIGMTNVQFSSIDDYDDIGMKNFYDLETAKGRPHEEIMQVIWRSGRDNSRTPMQWNDSSQAGFTTGKPWMKINPNYRTINVEGQKRDSQSIYHFYKKMIELRKKYQVFVYGEYDLLGEEQSDIYIYERKMHDVCTKVICNFSKVDRRIDSLNWLGMELLLSNYNRSTEEEEEYFHPYEIRIYLSKDKGFSP